MDELKKRRKELVAQQIRTAMEAAGINRKQLAERTGRLPSDVTRWLSGEHNFTIDLLSEISEALGTPITGIDTSSLVSGYATNEGLEPVFKDGGATISGLSLSPAAYNGLLIQARRVGKTVTGYAESILEREASKATISAFDFCGIWSDDEFDEAESLFNQIRGCRTFNRLPEL